MNDDQTPINSQPLRRRGPLTVIGDLWLAFQDRVLWPLGDSLRDGFALLSGTGRVLAVSGGALAVVAVAVGIYLAAGSGSSGTTSAKPVVAVAPEPTAETTAAPETKPNPTESTLQGAAPVFAPTKGDAKSVETPKSSPGDGGAAADSPAATTSSTPGASAATGKISSRPAAPGSVGAEISAIPGKPAGAKALKVAREFSGAFVVYETQGRDSGVRKAFADTATPDLTKALLKRPPRQPADVEVPKAKVLNIVPGPSRGSVYTVSVSLLRVGVTSELRLEMEKLKGEGWRVTNVLG